MTVSSSKIFPTVDSRYMFQILHSSDLVQLHVPRVRTLVGTRAFSVAAHGLWNELPLEICFTKTQISFLKKLKHTYFVSFFVRLFRLRSLNSDHRGFRCYRSLLLHVLSLILFLIGKG